MMGLLRPTTQVFAVAMEERLYEKEFEGVWEAKSLHDLIDMIGAKIVEMEEAYVDFQGSGSERDGLALQHACARVALLTMMIYSKAHPILSKHIMGWKPYPPKDTGEEA